MKQKTHKVCANTECKKEFKLFSTLQKFCSISCKKKIEGNKRIKPMSAKRGEQTKEYVLLREIYLKKHPRCEIALDGCTFVSIEIHHARKRIGAMLTNTEYFVATCRSCHNKAELENLKLK